MRVKRSCGTRLVLVGGILWGTPALAQTGGTAATTAVRPATTANPGAQPPAMSLRDALAAARGTDPERIIAGIEALGRLKAREAIPTIAAVLHNGPTDAVTDRAVEVLGTLGLPDAIPELASMLQHRRAAVRSNAIDALSYIRDERVRGLIEGGLDDSDRIVRGTAAQALLKLVARPSVPLLFRAFDRGVPEAAESIGGLAEPSVAASAEIVVDNEDPKATRHPRTLSMYLGRVPLSVLLPAFKRMLDRRDVPVQMKIRIIERLEVQASMAVRDFLQQWVRGLPASYQGADRIRANEAIQKIVIPSGGA